MKPAVLLKILLVMSMISAVSAFADSFFILFFPNLYAQTPSMMAQSFDAHLVDAMKQVVEINLALPQGFHLTMCLLWGLSFAGCLLMWKRRQSGFHCYTLAQLLLLLVPLLFIGKSVVGLGDVMFTLLFVFCYWRLMKTFEEPPMTSESSESSEPSD